MYLICLRPQAEFVYLYVMESSNLFYVISWKLALFNALNYMHDVIHHRIYSNNCDIVTYLHVLSRCGRDWGWGSLRYRCASQYFETYTIHISGL